MANEKKPRLKFRWPKITIDLSRRSHRFKLTLAVLVFVIVLVGIGVAGVKTYDYTESSGFCGSTCHVMTPQYARYQLSPHSNVACAECHIGPGASFFVRSKIDGLRQVYATIFNTYHRPIKSPVVNLRPARETCETCHSPTTFKDNIVKTVQHYDNDAANTPVRTTLILKMGGWQESSGIVQGIHWHVSSDIYYIAADEQRQSMLWVGVKQADGSMKEFFSRDLVGMGQTDFVKQARDKGQVRLMDCIDCHNRAAHYIPNPEQAVDQAIADGSISRSLPGIRAKAVKLLKASYASQAEAYQAFNKLSDDYALLPAISGNANLSLTNVDANLVAAAIDTLKKLYDQDNFPAMATDWQTNPNNEKHTPFLGCFRCHNDSLISVDPSNNVGRETISSACNLCHTVPIVGRGSEILIEAPVIVGAAPESHNDYSWTISHRSTTEAGKQQCYQCHGQGFCNNAACHNLSHPADMLFTHAEEYKRTGGQVCYTCHQNISCARCHAGGIIQNP